jgi:hypothetical protein
MITNVFFDPLWRRHLPGTLGGCSPRLPAPAPMVKMARVTIIVAQLKMFVLSCLAVSLNEKFKLD